MHFLNKKAQTRDFVVAAVMALLIFGTAHFFDVFEQIYSQTRQYESWELDELVLFLLSLPLPVAWFAYRRSQEALRETTHRLELERKLAHSHKLDSLGTLAGGLAHEINNQLLPVTTMAEMVREHMSETDPDRRKMDLIIAGASNARDTVSKITVFSRLPDNNARICDVSSVCHGAEDVLRISSPANARLSFQVEDGVGTIDMVESDLQGIIVNLFSNAVDALSGKPGDVSLSVRSIELGEKNDNPGLADGWYAKITVRDTGIGMGPDIKARMFDPFFTTKVVGQGVGLGLSVVHREVQSRGGEIYVDSVQGQGTTFNIYLPIMNQDASVAPTRREAV